MKLKVGTTEDPRLDRIPYFDDQSRDYPIRTLVAEKKPRSYTWRCDSWLDQGAEGACVGYAWTHELNARPAVHGLPDKFARETVYWEAQRVDPWPGGSYPGATPRYEGTSVLAGVKVIQKLGYVSGYRWAFGLDDLILAVGYAGPAVLGINWYSDMQRPDSKGFIRPSGKLLGGHAILCKGVSIPGRFFKLHNSWGKSWGRDAECYVSFKDMDILLNQMGEACIVTGRRVVR